LKYKHKHNKEFHYHAETSSILPLIIKGLGCWHVGVLGGWVVGALGDWRVGGVGVLGSWRVGWLGC